MLADKEADAFDPNFDCFLDKPFDSIQIFGGCYANPDRKRAWGHGLRIGYPKGTPARIGRGNNGQMTVSVSVGNGYAVASAQPQRFNRMARVVFGELSEWFGLVEKVHETN